MKLTNQLNVNLTEDVRNCLNEIEKRTGIKDQAIAKALFHALAHYWKTHEKITLPFEISSENEISHEKIERKKTKPRISKTR